MSRISPGYVPSPEDLRPRRMQGKDTNVIPEELKPAAFRFRDACAALLADLHVRNPVTHHPPALLALFRHICTGRANTSTAMQMKEGYIQSDVAIPEFGYSEEDAALLGSKLAFIIKEGSCRNCSETARSKEGRLVFSKERPPTAGRMVR